jgi:hypothetical protein
LGWQIFGIREGYDGIMEPERFPDGGPAERKDMRIKKEIVQL